MSQVFKKSIVRYLDADGRQVPKGTPDARHIKAKSTKWYGRVPGTPKPVPLSANKVVAQQMLAALINKDSLEKVHGPDPFAQHRERPLSEHMADYDSYLLAKGDGKQHVHDTLSRVRRIIEGCSFTFIADISLSAVQDFLARLATERPAMPSIDPAKEWYAKDELAAALGVEPHCIGPLVRRWDLPAEGQSRRRRFPRQTALALRERLSQPISPATLNHYVRAVRGFTRWLVKDRRTGDDALIGLCGVNADADIRRARRPLSPVELQRVLAVALDSDRTFRGLTGRDRHHLYLAACVTGYRAGELAVLAPVDFALDAEPATITLAAEHTKNGKAAVQPVPADAADALLDYLDGKPASAPVWPGTWHEDAAEMLRLDLSAAGVEYIAKGANGPEYRDFHSLRHAYVAMLDRAGCTLKEAMQLARHSDPKLTLARYGKAQLHDLAGKVELLPDLLNGTPLEANVHKLRATGTDGAAAQALPFSCSPVAQRTDMVGDSLTTIENTSMESSEGENKQKPPATQGVERDCERMITDDRSAPCRTRTYNPLIKSQLLCQLS